MFLWNIAVTSLAEVWIEILKEVINPDPISVTSLAEVWIEILPLLQEALPPLVTSLAEVWIEISIFLHPPPSIARHFPCGSVD